MGSQRVFAFRIWVEDSDGETHDFKAGDPVPDWALDVIENPYAYTDIDADDSEETPQEPAGGDPDPATEPNTAPEAGQGPGEDDGVEVPEGDLESLLTWVSEAEDPAERHARGTAVYDQESKVEDADLDELGKAVHSAVYGPVLEPAPQPVDYEALTIPLLKAEIDKRNEGREDDDLVVVEGQGNKPDLVAALVADDAAQSATDN